MPKRKPDPLAKVSKPNLIRLLKRRDAEIRRLLKVCNNWEGTCKHRRLSIVNMMQQRDAALAEVARLKQQLNGYDEAVQEINRLNDVLRDVLPRDGSIPVNAIITKVSYTPDPTAGMVVVKMADYETWPLFARIYERECNSLVFPPHADEPPSHPAPPVSLPVADCNRAPWTWGSLWRTADAPDRRMVAHSSPSPWPGVMRGNPFVGHNARPETVYWRIDPLLYQDDGHVRPTYWERSSGAGFLLHETYPLAHTGPVKIGGGE